MLFLRAVTTSLSFVEALAALTGLGVTLMSLVEPHIVAARTFLVALAAAKHLYLSLL